MPTFLAGSAIAIFMPVPANAAIDEERRNCLLFIAKPHL
jgi:hypothetical protein